MLLKYEATLIAYQYKEKTIYCRVNVVPTKSCEHQNTCRSLTYQQWQNFDKELRSWLDIKAEKDCPDSEEGTLCSFVVKPNVEVKIRKSTLSTKYFYKCVQYTDSSEVFKKSDSETILECNLEYKDSNKLPPTPSIPHDEYDPIASTVTNDNSISPLSYEPYTPSKRTRKYSQLDKIKTPGLDFLGFDSAEDGYSPKPERDTAESDITIPVYKPAPISESPITNDSEEVVPETEDESLSNKGSRSKRMREKRHLQSEFGEYVPESQETLGGAPTYKPTPIDDIKQNVPNVPKENKIKKDKEKEKNDCKSKSCEDRKLEETEKTSIEKTSSHRRLENKISSSSEDDLEKIISRPKDKSKKNEKSKYRDKDGKKDKDLKGDEVKREKKVHESVKEINKTSLSSSEEEFEKPVTQEKEKKKKDKYKEYEKKYTKEENNKERLVETKRKSGEDNEKQSSRQKDRKKEKHRSKESTSKSQNVENSSDPVSSNKDRENSPSVRRSERSPVKPRRFIDEQEKIEVRKKPKTSPKNKELFGTDDDDDTEHKQPVSDTNNNARSKLAAAFQTPKGDKTKSLMLSSSSSSSSAKKKRKRNECEQERADMSKWLGKKDKINKSTELTASKSFEEKSSKKLKSKKDEKDRIRSKSDSPPPIDIVMLSEKEMETIRNKAKLQCEDNARLKAVLDQMNVAPKEVEQLSLESMTLVELMDTFELYKTDLDKIYEKYRKKDHVKSHDGVNHCLVIGLIDQHKQFKMLEKLSEVYNSTNSTTHATLYANALLPEWILRIFMEKFNLTRCEAIQHIEDQEIYKSYLEAQNENSFLDDPI
ncbi:uncharacterized protein LOC142221840 [Haematobia irritans]|uniref:uncharacterized protein LOC142221840 n=1 Tax=Haematobia irritans TaxID=7368 RepID=UPI003F50421B